MSGCRASTMFAIKAIIREKPNELMLFLFLGSAIWAGYAMQVFERPLSEVSKQDFNSYLNSLWLIVVTMTTVGYGDVYPKTSGGRFIGMTICIWGMFLTSFFTVTLSNLLALNPA